MRAFESLLRLIMTILIYSKDAKDPGLMAQGAYDTLRRLFPSQDIQFSSTLDIRNLQSDDGFTLVVPGDCLSSLIDNMNTSGANVHCRDAVDNGANYIGFCAGAFYGAQHCLGYKDFNNPYCRFEKERSSFCEDFGGTLGMIENTWAIGPFLPFNGALGGRYKTYSHSVLLNDHGTEFHSMYIEGPMFMNQELSGPYTNQESIVADYYLPDASTIEIVSNGKSELIPVPKQVPAVLHEEKKGSHRYLIGPHPELASSARTFIPRFENAFCPKYLQPMTLEDKSLLFTEKTETQNFEFLKRTFGSILK
jgi:glutamine amidotransferase-like uncharacterized protein